MEDQKTALRAFLFSAKFGMLSKPLFSTYDEFIEYAKNIPDTKWSKMNPKTAKRVISMQFNYKVKDMSVKSYRSDFKEVAKQRLKERSLNEFEVKSIMLDFDEVFAEQLKLEEIQKSTA